MIEGWYAIVSYSDINGMSIDGVTSNTLNGIDIPILLQPSTKYELIYKEDGNKFELGGLKTLFDFTLEQAVNQIDLEGLSNKLKEGIWGNQMENIIAREKRERMARQEKIKERIVAEMRPFSFYDEDERKYIDYKLFNQS